MIFINLTYIPLLQKIMFILAIKDYKYRLSH